MKTLLTCILFVVLSGLAQAQLVTDIVTDSGKTYNFVENGLATGVEAYSDRDYTIGHIDPSLIGQSYIQSSNDDTCYLAAGCSTPTDTLMSFTLTQASTIYVAIHSDTELPNWLVTEGYILSSLDQMMVSGAPHDVYARAYPAGIVHVGQVFHPQHVVAIVPACGLNPKLQWDANNESDMAHYVLYNHGTRDVKDPAGQNFVIPHDGTAIIEDPPGSGNFVVRSIMEIQVPVGPTYFGVTAVDQAGNESVLSQVVGCQAGTIDLPPDAPMGFELILSVDTHSVPPINGMPDQ